MLEVTGGACAEQVAQNGVLGALNAADRAAAMPFLEAIRLDEGVALLVPGDRIPYLYFPRTGVVSMQQQLAGRLIEVALIGSEGFVGCSAVLGCSSAAQLATVQMQGGTALRLHVEDATLLFRSHPALLMLLLRFVDVTMTQIGATIASQMAYSTVQRVARWVLMRHDRLVGDQLLARHEQIATQLGVRRASVTDALHILEGERYLRCHRGQIQVIDRSGLEGFAGSAYGLAEARYRSLIGPFGHNAAPEQRRSDQCLDY